MSLTLTPATPRRVKDAFGPGLLTRKGIARLSRLALISGPRLLITTGLSLQDAALMILLCAPALLLCGMLIVPPLIFETPQENAYFYFAQILNQDPVRWIILAVAGVLSVISLAVPARTPNRVTAIRY